MSHASLVYTWMMSNLLIPCIMCLLTKYKIMALWHRNSPGINAKLRASAAFQPSIPCSNIYLRQAFEVQSPHLSSVSIMGHTCFSACRIPTFHSAPVETLHEPQICEHDMWVGDEQNPSIHKEMLKINGFIRVLLVYHSINNQKKLMPKEFHKTSRVDATKFKGKRSKSPTEIGYTNFETGILRKAKVQWSCIGFKGKLAHTTRISK